MQIVCGVSTIKETKKDLCQVNSMNRTNLKEIIKELMIRKEKNKARMKRKI